MTARVRVRSIEERRGVARPCTGKNASPVRKELCREGWTMISNAAEQECDACETLATYEHPIRGYRCGQHKRDIPGDE